MSPLPRVERMQILIGYDVETLTRAGDGSPSHAKTSASACNCRSSSAAFRWPNWNHCAIVCWRFWTKRLTAYAFTDSRTGLKAKQSLMEDRTFGILMNHSYCNARILSNFNAYGRFARHAIDCSTWQSAGDRQPQPRRKADISTDPSCRAPLHPVIGPGED
jgi:hypothetical protein